MQLIGNTMLPSYKPFTNLASLFLKQKTSSHSSIRIWQPETVESIGGSTLGFEPMNCSSIAQKSKKSHLAQSSLPEKILPRTYTKNSTLLASTCVRVYQSLANAGIDITCLLECSKQSWKQNLFALLYTCRRWIYQRQKKPYLHWNLPVVAAWTGTIPHMIQALWRLPVWSW